MHSNVKLKTNLNVQLKEPFAISNLSFGWKQLLATGKDFAMEQCIFM
jgi:hypothetical protein